MPGSNVVSAVVTNNLLGLPSVTPKTGTERWFVLLYDFVLYSFKKQTDPVALTATPLPGYTVSMGLEDLQHDPAVLEKDKERTIRIQHNSLCSSTSTTASNTNINQSGPSNNSGQPSGHASFKKVYYLVGSNVANTRRYFLCGTGVIFRWVDVLCMSGSMWFRLIFVYLNAIKSSQILIPFFFFTRFRWFEVLQLASRAELPSCCSEDNS